ncbi:MFS transporter [Piscirickettsia litoralis]|uniref:Major facilitator superfamily (MFS) profile domain-containing protein n=1 Tax=Piscirickettsia litoralis TaxID=1891921 RepID=A0ABX3A6P0_9GAMM|nr:hypothetical protein [Piscirickettsia litoralis]ODN41774.1 hypothetical protein BGC07_00735 [Piscirickettsia litoralis]
MILGLFLAFGPEVFIDHFHLTIHQYGNIALALCIVYILGNFTAKHIGNRICKRQLKFTAFFFAFLSTVTLTFNSALSTVLASFIVISFASGILTPMGTHGGMTVIKQHFGTAAAMYTALFSIFSACWSYLHAILNASPLTLITSILWLAILFCGIFEYFLPDQQPTAKKTTKAVLAPHQSCLIKQKEG